MSSIDVNLIVKQAGSAAKGAAGVGSTPSGSISAARGAAGMGKGLGAIAGTLGKMLGIVGILGMILTSSKGLMKLIGGLGKLLMLFLKPIGDTLMLFLKPLYMLIKPIAKAFSAYFKLYQKEANEAMKAGMTFKKAGMNDKAAESFMLAFMVAMKPFFNLIVMGVGESFKLLTDIVGYLTSQIYYLLGAIFSSIPGMEGLSKVLTWMGDQSLRSAEAIKGLIDSGITLLVDETDKWLFGQINKYSTLANDVNTLLDSMTVDETKSTAMETMFKQLDDIPINDLTLAKDSLKDMFDNISDGATDVTSLNTAMSDFIQQVRILKAEMYANETGSQPVDYSKGNGQYYNMDVKADIATLYPELVADYQTEFIDPSGEIIKVSASQMTKDLLTTFSDAQVKTGLATDKIKSGVTSLEMDTSTKMSNISNTYNGKLSSMENATVTKGDAIFRAFDGLLTRLESRANSGGGGGGSGNSSGMTFTGFKNSVMR